MSERLDVNILPRIHLRCKKVVSFIDNQNIDDVLRMQIWGE